MRNFIIHGHLSSTLAICNLLPIIKDKLGKSEDSNNYRSIFISSMVLKLFDWVIILIYKENLHLDALQFSYQPNCSTTMCSWMGIIDYFPRNGSEVFICTMDMTKGFDNVKHSKVFNQLLQREFTQIMMRFLMFLFEVQVANVKHLCPTVLRVRGWSFFNILRECRLGCWIN